MQVLGRNVERVTERRAQLPFDPLFTEQRNRSGQLPAAGPQIIQPEDVIGVRVRVDRCFDQTNSLAQQLQPQFRRRVDDERAAWGIDRDASACPMILRIGRRADRAIATDHRHTDAGAGAEQNEFAA